MTTTQKPVRPMTYATRIMHEYRAMQTVLTSANAHSESVTDHEDSHARYQELTALAALRAQIDARTEDAVIGMKSHGATWREIGEALSVTAQAAQQKYGTR